LNPVIAMKVAIIGKGNVGKALCKGLKAAGHEVRFGHRDPKEPAKDAAEWGEVIVLAVPFSECKKASKEIERASEGKPVIDATNPLAPNGGLAIGFTTSAGEEVQKALPKAKVVKAFNYVFAQNMTSGKLGSERLTAFIAGDDQVAKGTAMKPASDIGFDPVDAGPLASSRYLEPMAGLIIALGYGQKMGRDIGFKLARK
jgi:hypothetical protein